MNLFSFDSSVSRFLYLVADIVIAHFLWVVCSLPLFTIGAANTALYYSFMKRFRTDEGYVWKNFLKAFRENFRQSVVLWLIALAAGDCCCSTYASHTSSAAFLGASCWSVVPLR